MEAEAEEAAMIQPPRTYAELADAIGEAKGKAQRVLDEIGPELDTYAVLEHAIGELGQVEGELDEREEARQ
jgi:hypothetical protein